MWLKMYTGNVFIDQQFIDFYWVDTMIGRKELLENAAKSLRDKNVAAVTDETIFFYERESKMNRHGFEIESI